MTAEYRLTIKVRNNLLLRRIEATRGFVSVKQFTTKHGLHYATIADLIGMRGKGPTKRDGDWYEVVERLASILGADPVELFPQRQLRGEILATTVSREVSEAQLLALSEPEAMALVTDQTPEKFAEDRDLVKKLLAELSPRERAVVTAYYGLDDAAPKILAGIAKDYDTSTQRCYQFLRKAQTRMRSALYRKHEMMTTERYHELETIVGDYYDRPAWPGRDGVSGR